MKKIVMIIDDSPYNIEILIQILRDTYAILVANSGMKAMELLEKDRKPDLILLDVNMPEVSGYEVMEYINEREELNHIPVIFVTANSSNSAEIKGLDLGAVDYIKKPFNPLIVQRRIKNIIELKTYQDLLEEKVVERTKEIFSTQKLIIKKLSIAAEYNDLDTGYHIDRMSLFTKVIASMYGLSEAESELLLCVAPMHDIGKIGISNDLILKLGKLTVEEYIEVQKHCEIGKKIIGNHDIPLLNIARVVAYEHHERWDGKGYPQGLSGEDIHLYGRIVAVADVFDALLSKRVYKEVWSFAKAYNYIVDQSGTQFDPKVVDAFVNGKKYIKKITKDYVNN